MLLQTIDHDRKFSKYLRRSFQSSTKLFSPKQFYNRFTCFCTKKYRFPASKLNPRHIYQAPPPPKNANIYHFRTTKSFINLKQIAYSILCGDLF